MRHILAVLVENNPGVLTRVAGLFSRRGYNIDSLSVGRTESPNISRMTIVVEGDDLVLEQVTKQLHKLRLINFTVSFQGHLAVTSRAHCIACQ